VSESLQIENALEMKYVLDDSGSYLCRHAYTYIGRQLGGFVFGKGVDNKRPF
jgi:hypothetical protein